MPVGCELPAACVAGAISWHLSPLISFFTFHLFSPHLISAFLGSAHLVSAHFSSCLLISPFLFLAHSSSSQLISALFVSTQFFSSLLSSSEIFITSTPLSYSHLLIFSDCVSIFQPGRIPSVTLPATTRAVTHRQARGPRGPQRHMQSLTDGFCQWWFFSLNSATRKYRFETSSAKT